MDKTPVVHVSADVDVAQSSSERVARGEKDLLDFVDTASVGLHWVGPDGTILWANRADYELLGYDESEYIGRNITEFHADADVIAEILRKLGSGERLADQEARLRCKDGSIRHVLITSSVRFDDKGEFVHTRCFTLDVTGRLKAEADLRHAHEKLRVAHEAARMGTWEWDLGTSRVIWSPTLETIHGIPEGSFAGTFEAYQQDIHPEDKERVLCEIQETVSNAKDHHLEYRIIVPDGRVRWVEAHGRLIPDDAGRPIRMMGVCMDVTDRKNDDLLLHQRTEELRALGEFREMFIGIVAHDLRNPLSAIHTGVQYLLKSDELPEKHTKTAARIARSADRMVQMIADLLDFTHGRLGGGLPVTFAPMDMGEVGQRIIDEIETTNPGREIIFERCGDLKGTWDAHRVAQVFSNLASNALKHGEGPIKVALDGQDDLVTLVVTNRGEPIPGDALGTLFQPFRRATERTDGLGLGLYIVSEIVRAHGAKIEVASSAQEGTTFVTRWPREGAERPAEND